MLHASSFEDRPLVEQTLAQVNRRQERGHDAGLPQVTRLPDIATAYSPHLRPL